MLQVQKRFDRYDGLQIYSHHMQWLVLVLPLFQVIKCLNWILNLAVAQRLTHEDYSERELLMLQNPEERLNDLRCFCPVWSRESCHEFFFQLYLLISLLIFILSLLINFPFLNSVWIAYELQLVRGSYPWPLVVDSFLHMVVRSWSEVVRFSVWSCCRFWCGFRIRKNSGRCCKILLMWSFCIITGTTCSLTGFPLGPLATMHWHRWPLSLTIVSPRKLARRIAMVTAQDFCCPYSAKGLLMVLDSDI